MQVEILIPLLITTLVAIVGWGVAHRFTAARDLRNKRLELRTRYLLEAYRRIERSVGGQVTPEAIAGLESAIADIQLLGTKDQVHRARDYVHELRDKHLRELPVGPILSDLRDSLRRELGLDPLEGDVEHLRVQVSASRHEESSEDR
jgi:hypothetical protein